MKLLATIATLAVATVSAQTYLPLQNPGNRQCMSITTYNDSNDQYTIKFGSCTGNKKAIGFKHDGNGKALRTKDGYCLSTQKNSASDGVRLVLTDCPKTLNKGQKWTKAGRQQWKNGYGKCIDYKDGNFKQVKCATLASTDNSSKQQYVLLKGTPAPPPPPAPKDILCADWLKKYTCPSNKVPIPSPSRWYCKGATGWECNSVCCAAKPTITCASSGVRCPNDYKLAGNRQCGNYNQPKCGFEQCCDSAGPIKCRDAGVKCGYGQVLMPNQLCGTSKYGSCNSNTCCVTEGPKPPATCASQNYRCQPGSTLQPSVKCNSPGYPRCTEEICCNKPAPSTCGSESWRCPYGSSLKPAVKCTRNGAYGSPRCSDSLCCEMPKPQPTCEGKKCPAGQVLVDNPESVTDLNKCCRPDTCKLWADKEAAYGQTNEEKFCNKDGTTGPLVSGSDLTNQCKDLYGNPKSCDAKICCEPFLAVDPAPEEPTVPEPIQ